MTATTTDLDVRPITGACGAEVRGIDLASLGPDDWAAVHSIWLDHLVLFFPDQSLDAEHHIALGRRFGVPEVHPYLAKRDGHPEIVVMETNDGGGAEFWHTDVTFSTTPPMASILQVIVSPARGGDTLFTNQYLAYETLSAPLQELLEDLTAVHTAAKFGHPEQQATHPVIRTHPDTGRKSLFVNRLFTSHIPALRRTESDALLAYLYTWSEQPALQCRYRWTEGTVGIWDNRCTQHYAVPDYEGRRRVERVTVIGDVPRGRSARWASYEERRGVPRDATPIGPMATDPRANSMSK